MKEKIENLLIKINWWWVSAVCFGIWLLLVLIFSDFGSNPVPVQAAEVIPSGDLRDSEAVLSTWDSSTFYAPVQYFTNSISDTYYPGETVYYDGYAVLENSKIRFRYYVQGEQYDSFFPAEVMCAVFASDGTVLDHRYVKNEFSIYDYSLSRGSLFAYSDNLVYVNTDYGYSFVDLDVLGISGRVLYFSVYQNEVDHYYAAQISSGTFSILESPDSTLYDILSSELSSNISLFSWNSDTREWDLITTNASESVLKAYPVDKILRLQGTSALYLNRNADVRLEPVWFREDSVPPDPEVSPTPTPAVSSEPAFSFFLYGRPVWSQTLVPNLDVRTLNYYMVDVYASDIYAPLDVPLQGNTALAVAMSNYGVESPFIRPVVIQSYESTSNAIYIYFAGTLSAVKIYPIGTVLPSHNKDIIRQSYSAVDWVVGTEYSSSFYSGTSNGLNVVSAFLEGNVQYGTSVRPQIFELTLSGYGDLPLSGRPFYNAQAGTCFNYTNNTVNNALAQAYRAGMTNSSVAVPSPTPTPTPDPNATPTPTPSPAPTEPPHVIINWPTNTPMPTPSIKWNPPGSKDTDLPGGETKTILGRGLDWFRTQMNGGLFAKAFSFLPSEVQWLAWFLIFVLLILAVVRLLIHFGG